MLENKHINCLISCVIHFYFRLFLFWLGIPKRYVTCRIFMHQLTCNRWPIINIMGISLPYTFTFKCFFCMFLPVTLSCSGFLCPCVSLLLFLSVCLFLFLSRCVYVCLHIHSTQIDDRTNIPRPILQLAITKLNTIWNQHQHTSSISIDLNCSIVEIFIFI